MAVSAAHPHESARVFLIESGPSLYLLVRTLLRLHAIEVTPAEMPAEARLSWCAARPDLIIIDSDAYGLNLQEPLGLMEADAVRAPVVSLSTLPPHVEERLQHECIRAFVRKPFDNDELGTLIGSLSRSGDGRSV